MIMLFKFRFANPYNKKQQIQHFCSICRFLFMQEMGLEPTQPCDYRHLKPARLPFRHSCEQLLFYRILLQMSTPFFIFFDIFLSVPY